MSLKITVSFQLLAVEIAAMPLQTAEVWGEVSGQWQWGLTAVVLAILALLFGPSSQLLWAITWAEQVLRFPEGFWDK